MDALFEFFFKYRPVVYEKGSFAFGAGWPVYLIVVAAIVLAVPAIISYGRVRVRGTARHRAVLTGLRVAAVAIVLVCLLRPILVISEAVPQRNVVGVLLDDSRSMRITDLAGKSRADVVRSLFGVRDSALFAALADKFILRFFRFAGTGDRVTGVGELAFDGTRTQLGPALEGARQELAGAPLSGLVVLSDGADNSAAALTDPLLSLRSRHIPVYTVGIGREHFDKDIEITRVETPRSVLTGASLAVNAIVTQRGYRGRKVQLVVEDSGHIVNTEDVTLASDGEAQSVRVRVPTKAAGSRLLSFRIAPQEGEMVTENNTQHAVVVVNARREKILYVDGEPRYELAFMRRGVQDDKNLQVVTINRTAKDKLKRMSLDDSLDLITGFPKSREELFAYRGIILGSVEASFFTLDQLRMLADFVSQRGGGLIMLGGRDSFSEGGYAGTPLADVLPVDLTYVKDGAPPYFMELKVGVTPAGAVHPATQIAQAESASVVRWKTMPAVSSVNRIVRTKPGAFTLLTGAGKDGSDKHIVLAWQRYGRGKSIALPVQDTWMWQMHADIEVEDMTFESFWRQMLRWLVSDVPGRVTVATSTDRSDPGDAVELRVDVSDKAFLKVNSAQATARIVAPSGAVTEMPLDWSVTRDGEYRATFTPTEKGVYRVQAVAQMAADSLTSEPAYVEVADLSTEYFGAEMRPTLLKRVAEETGGRFYTPATVSALPKDIVYSQGGNTIVQRLDLWDMPLIFIILIAVLGSEWAFRRARGLA